jgi:hypothetical protein
VVVGKAIINKRASSVLSKPDGLKTINIINHPNLTATSTKTKSNSYFHCIIENKFLTLAAMQPTTVALFTALLATTWAAPNPLQVDLSINLKNEQPFQAADVCLMVCWHELHKCHEGWVRPSLPNNNMNTPH